MSPDFAHRRLAIFGNQDIHRLGLASNYGLDERGMDRALDRGLNYLFWTPTQRTFTRVLKRRLQKSGERQKLIVAGGSSLAYLGGSVRRGAERALKALGTDYLDLFQLYWLGTTSSWTPGVVEEMVKLKESGVVRALGISIHDRPRAGKLAEDSPLDLLMVRYNAAHPGAEKDIFPHLERRKPAIVAYTATSWRKLLKAPRGWKGPVPTAGDCYRFCLTHPSVDVTLTGPASDDQLDANLAALEKGPLTDEEMTWMRSFGAAVHG